MTHLIPKDQAQAQIGTERYFASLRLKRSIIGFQYHPEISGNFGAKCFDKILFK